MSNLNSSNLTSRLISAEMFDDWSHLLPDPDRSAFLKACAKAEPDDGRLQTVLSRYFSTWKTSLMADELSRLQILATCEQIRDYVRVVCVEDDFDEFEETYPSKSDVIWPRHEDGQVIAEALGAGLLKSMFAAKQLRPDRLEIRDKRTTRAPSDPDTARLLARSTLDEAGLAFKAFSVRKDDSPMTTIIIAELSPQHQGRGHGVLYLAKSGFMPHPEPKLALGQPNSLPCTSAQTALTQVLEVF